MSIDFNAISAAHGGGLAGFLSAQTLTQCVAAPYDDLWVGHADLGDITQLQPAPMADRGIADLAGYGTAFDPDVARQRAIGEAVERYASVMFPTTNIVRGTARALTPDALSPLQFPCCSPSEVANWGPHMRLRQTDLDSEMDWTDAWSITENRRRLVPLDMAYMGRQKPLSQMVAPPISTGFAAGATLVDAIASGLQEVVERDAVALWWWGRRQVPHLSVTSLNCPVLSDFNARSRQMGIRTILLDLTTDIGLPVVGALQLSATWPHVVFMSACRTTRAAAALRCVEEAGSVRQALAQSRQRNPDPISRTALCSGTPHDPVDFARYYADSTDTHAFDFCLSPAPADHAITDAVMIPATIDRLCALGHEVIVVDCSLPETHALGFQVVRVIVPGLMGISFTHALRFLGEPRFARLMCLAPHIDPVEVSHDEPLPFA